MPPLQNNFPQSDPVAQNNPRRHSFLITLTILLILTGIFGIWYFSNPLPEENFEETVLTKKDQFSGWKTYRNEEYGFEIKYPSEYFTQSAPKGRPLIATINTKQILFEGDEVSPIEIKQVFSKSFYEEVNKIKLKMEGNYDQSTTTVDNIKAIKVAGKLKEDIFGWGGTNHGYIVIDSNPKILEIEYDKENLELNNIFDQILSTFKFISTSTPVNNL